MIVELMRASDRERVDWIAREAGQNLDVAAEEARSFGRLTVAREGHEQAALGVLSCWAVADELHVINLATHPGFRRRGVARALLDDALTQAARDRRRLVLLEVRRTNQAAIQLYRQLGFTVAAVRRGYYADNSEDAIEMMLAIDPDTGLFLSGHDEIELEEA